MIKIVEEYRNWRKACENTQTAIKTLQYYKGFPCVKKRAELELDKSSYSLSLLNCGTVQRQFYIDDAEYCAECPNYKEFGTYKEMAKKVYEAREKQRHAKIRFINSLCFWRTK